jgi:hypothetical protein
VSRILRHLQEELCCFTVGLIRSGHAREKDRVLLEGSRRYPVNPVKRKVERPKRPLARTSERR